jgi:hypothetical protein
MLATFLLKKARKLNIYFIKYSLVITKGIEIIFNAFECA